MVLPHFIRKNAFRQVCVFLQHPLPPEFAGENRIKCLKRLKRNLVNEEQCKSKVQSLIRILGEHENEATQQDTELDHQGHPMKEMMVDMKEIMVGIKGTMDGVKTTTDNLTVMTDNLKATTDTLKVTVDGVKDSITELSNVIHDEREARIFMANKILKRFRLIDKYLPSPRSPGQIRSPLNDNYLFNEQGSPNIEN